MDPFTPLPRPDMRFDRRYVEPPASFADRFDAAPRPSMRIPFADPQQLGPDGAPMGPAQLPTRSEGPGLPSLDPNVLMQLLNPGANFGAENPLVLPPPEANPFDEVFT